MNGLGTRLGDSRLIHDHDAQKEGKAAAEIYNIYNTYTSKIQTIWSTSLLSNTQLYFMHTLVHETDALC